MPLADLLKRILPRPPAASPPPYTPGPPRLLHFVRESDGQFRRFHLRIHADGSGLLIADATSAVRLSPTAVQIVHRLLDETPPVTVIAELVAAHPDASRTTIDRDVHRLDHLFTQLLESGARYPILNLEDPAFTSVVSPLTKPITADAVLPPGDGYRRLLDRLWEFTIPHVIFIPASDTLDAGQSESLVHAVQRAEDLGLIAGLRLPNARAISLDTIRALADAGLDHLNVPFAAATDDDDATKHDPLLDATDLAAALAALDAARTAELCPVAEIPLTAATADLLDDTLATLADRGVTHVSVYAIAVPDPPSTDDSADLPPTDALYASALLQVAAQIEDLSEELGIRFLWLPPVERDVSIPLATQLARGPRTSGDASIRVDADGAVYTPRGPYIPAGNLYQDDWSAIWEHPTFKNFRHRVESPTHCDACPGLAICAPDCPADPRGWANRANTASNDTPSPNK